MIMKKTVTIEELNDLLQDWKLRDAKCTFAMNKSIDIEECKRLKAEGDAISRCCLELWGIMSGETNAT